MGNGVYGRFQSFSGQVRAWPLAVMLTIGIAKPYSRRYEVGCGYRRAGGRGSQPARSFQSLASRDPEERSCAAAVGTAGAAIRGGTDAPGASCGRRRKPRRGDAPAGRVVRGVHTRRDLVVVAA